MNQPSAFQIQYPLSSKKVLATLMKRRIITSLLIVSILVGTFLSYIFIPRIHPDYFIVGCIIFGIIIFVISVYLMKSYIKKYVQSYYYDCGDQGITLKENLFRPIETKIEYQKIKNVYINQNNTQNSSADRFFDIWNVCIDGATDKYTSTVTQIGGFDKNVAESIKNIILSKMGNTNNSQI